MNIKWTTSVKYRWFRVAAAASTLAALAMAAGAAKWS